MATKVDLHMHSIYSDGSDTAEELVSQLQEKAISIFSLTDHDTLEGCLKVAEIVPKNIKFIYGIEFSARTSSGKCHILGYDYDPFCEDIQKIILQGKKLRSAKFQTRLEYLKRVHGIEFSEEVLKRLYGLESVGKPHIARELVNMGLAGNITEAIRLYLDGCKTGNDRVEAAEAIRAIRQADGIAVWAHPLGGEGERHLSEKEFTVQLETLLSYGIQGLECYYSRYTWEEVLFLLNAAEQYNLLVSGGSDYHGCNKNIPIGMLNAVGKEVFQEQLTVLKAIDQKDI